MYVWIYLSSSECLIITLSDYYTRCFSSENAMPCFVLQTFSQADSDGDDKIDTKEWNGFVKNNPSVLRNMSLPYLQ
jgi:hypothetical protein